MEKENVFDKYFDSELRLNRRVETIQHREPIKVEERNVGQNYREITFYSEKIESKDWKNLFKHSFKKGVPLFDFLDLSQALPLNRCNLVIERNENTVRFYIKEKKNLRKIAPLLFPFNFKDEKVRLNEKKKGLSLGLFFITKTNILDFLTKERIVRIDLSVFPILNKVFAIGQTVNEEGSKKNIIVKNPSKFLEIDMENNPSFYLEFIHHPILKSVHMESYKPLFEKEGTSIGADTYDVFKHSLIVGMSGTGKSKFIQMKTKAIIEKHPNSNVLIVDPHGEFKDSIEGVKVVDFRDNYIEPLESEDESPLTIQLIAQLISSIIDNKNKYAERVVFYSVHLLSELNELTLDNVGKLLTDTSARMEYSVRTKNEEVKRFFSTEFENIYINHFNDAVLPILNFIGQYGLYMGEKKNKETLKDLLENNKVTVISFNPNYFGREMIKFFAGAIIQQMYILAVTKMIKKPTILIVDEFPVVKTQVVKNILSETRKFNLHLYLSMQYLAQIEKDILDSLLTNMYNLIMFKISREDAKYVSGVMDIKVEEYFRKNWSLAELEEEKKNMFTYLSPRECIVRLYGNDGKFMMPMKVKTSDIGTWVSKTGGEF